DADVRARKPGVRAERGARACGRVVRLGTWPAREQPGSPADPPRPAGLAAAVARALPAARADPRADDSRPGDLQRLVGRLLPGRVGRLRRDAPGARAELELILIRRARSSCRSSASGSCRGRSFPDASGRRSSSSDPWSYAYRPG